MDPKKIKKYKLAPCPQQKKNSLPLEPNKDKDAAFMLVEYQSVSDNRINQNELAWNAIQQSLTLCIAFLTAIFTVAILKIDASVLWKTVPLSLISLISTVFVFRFKKIIHKHAILENINSLTLEYLEKKYSAVFLVNLSPRKRVEALTEAFRSIGEEPPLLFREKEKERLHKLIKYPTIDRLQGLLTIFSVTFLLLTITLFVASVLCFFKDHTAVTFTWFDPLYRIVTRILNIVE